MAMEYGGAREFADSVATRVVLVDGDERTGHSPR